MAFDQDVVAVFGKELRAFVACIHAKDLIGAQRHLDAHAALVEELLEEGVSEDLIATVGEQACLLLTNSPVSEEYQEAFASLERALERIKML